MRGEDDPLERAEERRRQAHRVLGRLGLPGRLERLGTPALVGSVAHGLVVAPDIDLDTYCPAPSVEDAFEVYRPLLSDPAVHAFRYSNHAGTPDAGLYFQLRYDHDDGRRWKIDLWVMPDDYAGARAADVVTVMREALDESSRAAILTIKEDVLTRGMAVQGARIYHAVIDLQITSADDCLAWDAALDDDRWIPAAGGFEQLASSAQPARIPVYRVPPRS